MSAAGFPAALFAAGMRRAMGGHVCAISAGGGTLPGGGRLPIAPYRRTTLCVGFPLAIVSHEEILPEPARIFTRDIFRHAAYQSGTEPGKTIGQVAPFIVAP